jgi:hypothetical protein
MASPSSNAVTQADQAIAASRCPIRTRVSRPHIHDHGSTTRFMVSWSGRKVALQVSNPVPRAVLPTRCPIN